MEEKDKSKEVMKDKKNQSDKEVREPKKQEGIHVSHDGLTIGNTPFMKE